MAKGISVVKETPVTKKPESKSSCGCGCTESVKTK